MIMRDLIAPYYPWVVLVHLACAIVFVGAVAFEVLVLEALHKHFDTSTLQRLEEAVMIRARRFMPIVVLLLFVSGGLLFDLHCNGLRCIGTTRFGWFLLLKAVLALGVLGVFVNASWAGARSRMGVCRFRYTHRIVLAMMMGIVFLAKAMFYL